jgi:hypothetical protein
MQKTWNWKFVIKAAKVVYGTLLGLLVIILPVELWGALKAPQEYPFGMEGPVAGMWAYKSQANYLISCGVFWLTSSLATWALFAKRASLRSRCLWSVPFLIVWALEVFDGSRLE